jgi:hypothetical protein
MRFSRSFTRASAESFGFLYAGSAADFAFDFERAALFVLITGSFLFQRVPRRRYLTHHLFATGLTSRIFT